MFTYFKKKEQETNKDNQRKQIQTSKNKANNDKQSNSPINGVLKLPSHIMQQLISAAPQMSNNNTQKKVSNNLELSNRNKDNQLSNQQCHQFQANSLVQGGICEQSKTQNKQQLVNQTKAGSTFQDISKTTQQLERTNKSHLSLNTHRQAQSFSPKTQQRSFKSSNDNARIQNNNSIIKQIKQPKQELSSQNKKINKQLPPTYSSSSSLQASHKQSFISIQNHDLQSVVTSIIQILTQQIQSEIIGQKISFTQLISTLKSTTIQTIQHLNSSFYQAHILQTKQRYNNLVEQSTNIFSKSRKIATLINEFVMSINLFLQSQELLIPCQQIQKSISQLNPQRTQKYINYLIKIFESNFDQVIEKRVLKVKSGLQAQLRKQQKAKKQLQNELRTIKQNLKNKQSTFYQHSLKYNQKQSQIMTLKNQIQQLTQKNTVLSSSTKSSKQDFDSQLLLVKRQLQRCKKQLQESIQKSGKLQRLIQKRDKTILQKQQQIQKLGQIIKKVKQVQYEGLQDIVSQMQTKQRKFQQKIQDFNSQKMNLQARIKSLKVQNQQLISTSMEKQTQILKLNQAITKSNEQIKQLKQKCVNASSSSENNSLSQAQQSKQSIQSKSVQQSQQSLRYQQANTEVDLSTLVNKQILGHLFVSFEDQSKEWAIRNNIRNQIYILLDIKKNKGGNSSTSKVNIKSKMIEKDIQQKNIQQKESQSNNALKSQSNNALKNQNNKQNPQPQPQQQSSLIGKLFGW